MKILCQVMNEEVAMEMKTTLKPQGEVESKGQNVRIKKTRCQSKRRRGKSINGFHSVSKWTIV